MRLAAGLACAYLLGTAAAATGISVTNAPGPGTIATARRACRIAAIESPLSVWRNSPASCDHSRASDRSAFTSRVDSEETAGAVASDDPPEAHAGEKGGDEQVTGGGSFVRNAVACR